MLRPHSIPRVLLAAAVAGLAACGGDATGSKAGPAAHLDAVGGNTQTAPVNTELPQPVVVKVTDARGHVVKGQVVNFVVTAGGGHVFAGTALTNDDGIAQERWTLGPAVGAQTLEARAVDSSTGQALVFATFSATATAGPPTQADPTGASATDGDTVVVGVVGSVVEDSFAVLVRDAGGNPVPGAQVAWAVTGGGGTITSQTTADAAGVARTQWVLGASAGPQTAQATVAGATVRFTAYPADQLVVDAGNGQTGGPGIAVTVRVGAKSSVTGGIPGLPIHWTVASGGGSVAPAVEKTVSDPNGRGLGIASAQWTLGPPGPQALTASAGGLSVTFTATSLTAGTRTLLAQVPGRVLDATADRVLWIDGATRVIRVRTLSNGADATVKTDTVKSTSAVWTVNGHLYTGGALVWNLFSEIFDWHAGATTYLGKTDGSSHPPAVDGDWASYYLQGTGLQRRNLATATSATLVPGGGVLNDVGPDGTVVWLASLDLVTWHDGTTTSVPTTPDGMFGVPDRLLTDGVNSGYTTVSFSYLGAAYLSRPGGDELLDGTNLNHGGKLYSLFAGGWAAYGTERGLSRRAPGGTKGPLAGSGAVLQALSPAGTVVYSLAGQYYRVAANGTTSALGAAAAGETVVWAGDRFILLSGGSAYDLGS
jgi:hypothetical protein